MTRTTTVAHCALALCFLIPPRLLRAPSRRPCTHRIGKRSPAKRRTTTSFSTLSPASIIRLIAPELLQPQFSLVREAGLKMVLRFVYNDRDKAVDARPDWALRHLEQLHPALQCNNDVLPRDRMVQLRTPELKAWLSLHAVPGDLLLSNFMRRRPHPCRCS